MTAELIAKIKACQYLALKSLYQEYDGPLCLIIEESRIDDKEEQISEFEVMARPITFTPKCQTFLLSWDSYVSYCVTGDEFPPHDKSLWGVNAGYFQEDTLSDFMSYIQKEKSQLFDIWEHPIHNWCIVTSNRYVEVVSYAPLEISLVM